jgi:asparagine synthase (glutamine-hydrolysing)
MCGIAGIYNLTGDREISRDTLERMIALIRHRGPDGTGYYQDRSIGLGHTRLSIIDVEGGKQPMHNEDRSIWITFNGEIFNYRELRPVLESKGHRFATHSDTEVIIHCYEEYGQDCLKHLNGQFAFALWDAGRQRLFIARDRVGIRPLFYTITEGQLLFASEVKALFADQRVKREIDPRALDQIFTFWMAIPPRTVFQGVHELTAGHYLMIENGEIKKEQYWDVDFSPEIVYATDQEYAEALRALLIDATKLQLRADVPVGAYLSGGLDSSVITSIIKNHTDTPLRTFSVTFSDAAFDESAYQRRMIDYLGTDHSDIRCGYDDIGKIFPDVIWHTEKPVLRTAAAPLFLLSKLVQDSRYKVVLTGEGSDEILAGYDLFKEVKIRAFLERVPGSRFRPLILKRLYPYLANSPVRSLHYAEAFFSTDSTAYPAVYRSHVPRWTTTAKTQLFFSDALKQNLHTYDKINDLCQLTTDDMAGYDPLSQAQYLEIKTLLPGYLLSSQGDRVAMAHSIEGRFPFLDHRVIEFCSKVPPTIRMRALTEKYILKKSMNDILPAQIIKRTKQPYMAPDSRSFFSGAHLDYLEELLSEEYLRKSGYFNPKAVSMLVKKCRQSPTLGFKDNMAMVGIISTLLVHDMFIRNFDSQRGKIEEQAGTDKYAGKI